MESLKTNTNAHADGYQAYVSEESEPQKQDESKEQKRILTPEVLKSKYTYIREIGHGTQGHVFHARRLEDGVDVAIKVLDIDSVKNWKEYELFQREVDVLSSLQMDGVAKFYEAIEDLESARPAAYLVQEFIPGTALSDKLKSGYRISINRIYDLLLQLLDILEALHTHDPAVIHRDIKPSNIILKPKGGDMFDVYLIDFGAVANPQVQHGGSTVAGTYGYMPPEQLMGKPCPGSDIYALGALAVNLITGIAPGDMPVKDHHLVFEQHMQNMPQAVQATIRQMLEPSLDLRMCDYEELRKRFRSFKKAEYVIDLKNLAENLAPVGYLTKQKYNNALQEVTSLGMPGSLELWQRLPDETPRTVPDCYAPVLVHPEALCESPLFSMKRDASSSQNNKAVSIILLLLLLVCAGWIITALSNLIIGIIATVVIAAGYAGIRYAKQKKAKSLSYNDNGSHATGVAGSETVSQSIQKLITDGCKTIATVIDVTYVPTDADKVEVLLENKNLVQCGYHGLPSFKIRYKFNPPDDSNPNDLIHEVIIHSNPEKTCRPGDPITILYRIFYEGTTNEIVESIPFPFPIGDIQDLGHMVGHSTTKL